MYLLQASQFLTMTFMAEHYRPTYRMALEKVITCTLTFIFRCASDLRGPHQKYVACPHGLIYLPRNYFLIVIEVRHVGEQLYILTKMLSKPRCWCEQLGIWPWWYPQLIHIWKQTENQCNLGIIPSLSCVVFSKCL